MKYELYQDNVILVKGDINIICRVLDRAKDNRISLDTFTIKPILFNCIVCDKKQYKVSCEDCENLVSIL